MSETTTSVYLIYCPDNIYKIGITKNVEKRMSNLQGSCPFELTLIDAFPTSQPRTDEQDLHDALSHWRMHGEWFRLRPSTAALVKGFYEARREAGKDSTLRLAEHVKLQQPPAPETNGGQRQDRIVGFHA